MGGGARNLGLKSNYTEKGPCKRKDGLKLYETWQQANPGSKVVTNTADLMSINIDNTTKLMGLFADSHLPYAAVKPDYVPSLSNMTLQAIRMLRKNDKGFFLLVCSHF